MKNLILIIFLLIPITSNAFDSSPFSFQQSDTQAHLGFSAAGGLVSSAFCRLTLKHSKTECFFLSLLTVNALGFFKESSDEFIDTRDLAANLGGSMVGASLSFVF